MNPYVSPLSGLSRASVVDRTQRAELATIIRQFQLQLHCYAAWMLFAPLVLLIQSLPQRRIRTRIVELAGPTD